MELGTYSPSGDLRTSLHLSQLAIHMGAYAPVKHRGFPRDRYVQRLVRPHRNLKHSD
jgi:hypothetical protein